MPQANSTTSRPRLTSPAASDEHLAVLGGDRSPPARPRGRSSSSRNANSTCGALGQRRPSRQAAQRARPRRPPRRHRRREAKLDLPGDLAGRRVEDVAAPARPSPSNGLPSMKCVDRGLTPPPLPPPLDGSRRRGSPAPPRASSSVNVSGGPMRSTLPCRPPLPMSRPRPRPPRRRGPSAAGPAVGAGHDELDRRSSVPCRARRRRSRARSLQPAARRSRIAADPVRVCLQVVRRAGSRGRRSPAAVDERVAAEGRDRVRPAMRPSPRPAPTTPPIGEPVAETLGEGEQVGYDAVRLDSPRSARRFGPSRSAPRR